MRGTVPASTRDDRAMANLRQSLPLIYDFYRTCLLNVKYYGHRLHRANQFSVTSEIVVIAGSATSGISGWAIWTWGYGKDVWILVVSAATLIAAIKPVLQINKKIELYSKQFGGHNSNYLAMKNLVERIQAKRFLAPELEAEYRSIYERYEELARDDDPAPSKKLLTRFQLEVEEQIPASHLWWGE
jgi:hypothetical protein